MVWTPSLSLGLPHTLNKNMRSGLRTVFQTYYINCCVFLFKISWLTRSEVAILQDGWGLRKGRTRPCNRSMSTLQSRIGTIGCSLHNSSSLVNLINHWYIHPTNISCRRHTGSGLVTPGYRSSVLRLASCFCTVLSAVLTNDSYWGREFSYHPKRFFALARSHLLFFIGGSLASPPAFF